MKGKRYTTEDKIRILREADSGKAINFDRRASSATRARRASRPKRIQPPLQSAYGLLARTLDKPPPS